MQIWRFLQQKPPNRIKKENNKKSKEKERREEAARLLLSLYNENCKNYPSIDKLSEAQLDEIDVLMKEYTLQDFEKAFKTAEESEFLKGDNDREWRASFSWMITKDNLVKILQGNYNRPASSRQK